MLHFSALWGPNEQKIGTLLTWPKVISPQNSLPNLSTDSQDNANFEAKKRQPQLECRTLIMTHINPCTLRDLLAFRLDVCDLICYLSSPCVNLCLPKSEIFWPVPFCCTSKEMDTHCRSLSVRKGLSEPSFPVNWTTALILSKGLFPSVDVRFRDMYRVTMVARD